MPEFMRQPPEWLLCVLWASLALVVLRVLWWGLWALLPALPMYLLAKLMNAPVTLGDVVRLQRLAGRAGMQRIVHVLIASRHCGLELPVADLAALHLSGGHIGHAVLAVQESHEAGLRLGWQEVVALQLDGQDILAAVREAAQFGSTARLDRLRAGLREKAGRTSGEGAVEGIQPGSDAGTRP
jgi:uncharacterized protein YqfA (UPF0365 family)